MRAWNPDILPIDVLTDGDKKIIVTYNSGEKICFDLSSYLSKARFHKLNVKENFETAFIDFDTIAWCGGKIDIAPEVIYSEGKLIN